MTSKLVLVCFSSSLNSFNESYNNIFLGKKHKKLYFDVSNDDDLLVEGPGSRSNWVQLSVSDALVKKITGRANGSLKLKKKGKQRDFEHHQVLTESVIQGSKEIDKIWNIKIQTLLGHFCLQIPDIIVNNVPNIYFNAFNYSSHVLKKKSYKKPNSSDEDRNIDKKRRLLICQFSSLLPSNNKELSATLTDEEKIAELIKRLDAPTPSIFLVSFCQAISAIIRGHYIGQNVISANDNNDNDVEVLSTISNLSDINGITTITQSSSSSPTGVSSTQINNIDNLLTSEVIKRARLNNFTDGYQLLDSNSESNHIGNIPKFLPGPRELDFVNPFYEPEFDGAVSYSFDPVIGESSPFDLFDCMLSPTHEEYEETNKNF